MNGIAALHVCLAVAEIGPGDEVLEPPRTVIATAFSVLHQNSVPVFTDIDLVSIKQHISERTKAIICVHVAGLHRSTFRTSNQQRECVTR